MMWYRIFASSGEEISPVKLLEYLHQQNLVVEGHFRGDDLGWTGGEFKRGNSTPIYLERYLAKEDDIRDDLNTWAAWLETANYEPNRFILMERVIQTQQLFTLRKPLDWADEIFLDKLCLTISQFLAQQANGIYQIDSEGFFASDGTMLLKVY
jgi:hypothetical protein